MRKRILIIDDEIDVTKMIAYRLKAKGYEVATALTGKKAIDMAHKQKFDLMLLDYRLPDIKAQELSKKFKSDKALKEIPILLITASIERIADKAKECQAVSYIAKPVEAEQLYEKVVQCIQ